MSTRPKGHEPQAEYPGPANEGMDDWQQDYLPHDNIQQPDPIRAFSKDFRQEEYFPKPITPEKREKHEKFLKDIFYTETPVVENKMAEVQQHGSYNKPGQGVKHDQGKPQVHYIPWDLLAGEHAVWADGADKYSPNQWRNGIPVTQGLNAVWRHLFLQFAMGEDMDPETTKHHLDHAICCIRMMQNTLKYHPQLDDRIKWAPDNKGDD